MKKRALFLLLVLCLLLSVLPVSFADGPNYETIHNYEELIAATGSSDAIYILDPDADFGWPEEPTELSVIQTLYLAKDWTIPEQITLKLSGRIQCSMVTDSLERTLTVNGTLEVSNSQGLKVHKLIIGGTLICNGYNISLGADEGELLSTGTIRVVSSTNSYRFTLAAGPVFLRDHEGTPTDWIFHEGGQLLGQENVSVAGEMIIGHVSMNGVIYTPVIRAEGTFRTDFGITMYTESAAQLWGSWDISSLKVNGESTLEILGQVKTRTLNLHNAEDSETGTRILIPENSLLALEQRENQSQWGSTAEASGDCQLMIDGTLRLGAFVHLSDQLKLRGNGTIVALAKYDDGTNQPFFLTPDLERITFSQILTDRAAYAELVAETLKIERSWKIVPRIVQQPESVTVQAGQSAVFTAQAENAATCHWMYHDGQSLKEIPESMGSGVDTPTLTILAKPEYSGYGFRCMFTSIDGVNRFSETVTLTVEAGNPFSDVPAGAYYETPVLWAVENGITAGTGPTSFSPNKTCTRGQVVTFLWRAKGNPEPTAASNPFTDVYPSDYYYQAVLWAVENGITAGTSKTGFSPGLGCTRAQVVTFLWRVHGMPSMCGDLDNPFTDVKSGAYYYDAVLWAVANEITSGTDRTHFSPDGTCTRAQVVTFLYRDFQ